METIIHQVYIYGPKTGEKEYGVDYTFENSRKNGIQTLISEQEMEILKDQRNSLDEIIGYIKDKLSILNIPKEVSISENQESKKAA